MIRHYPQGIELLRRVAAYFAHEHHKLFESRLRRNGFLRRHECVGFGAASS